MGLAGHEQHAQMLAHHVHLDYGDVVISRELAFDGRRLQLNDHAPGVLDRDLDRAFLACYHLVGGDYFAVSTERHSYRRARGKPRIEHSIIDALRLTEDGKARRAVEYDAPVALALAARHERVDRRVEAERLHVCRHVVDHAIGEHHDASHSLRRHVIERLA